jgi:hypothetical protein
MTRIDEYYIYHKRIHEHVIEGKRLGRHIKKDSRNGAYPYVRQGVVLKDNEVQRFIDILNQANTGSCTGNAKTGELGSGALYAALHAPQAFKDLVLDEPFAQSLYSAAENIDGDGPFPPNDNGSTGQSVSQAALDAGYIGKYTHITILNDILDALSSDQAVIVGSNWYDDMDHPGPDGLVSISANASVRGGHEYLARKIDVERRLIGFDNSWGITYGVGGSFWYSWDTMTRLLAEDGDGCVSDPITVAAA